MNSLLDYVTSSNIDPGEGARQRDRAFERLNTYRAGLIRRLQRAFVQHLIDHGPSTIDAIRDAVRIPPGIDPRVVGCAVAMLASQHKITKSIGAAKSIRKAAHARRMEIWALRDVDAGRAWVLTHPEVESVHSTDPNDPFAV